MHYTVKQLAGLTGLTPRTLRYYDAIGLLRPGRDRENDYRLYGSAEVDRLQQILLYREMGLPLEVIGNLLDTPGFDRAAALREHLRQLQNQRRRLDTLIGTVRRTLSMIEGGDNMSDQEKFEGMKQRAIAENEAAYGREARERYGDQTVDDSCRRVAGMTEEAWKQMKEEEAGYQAALLRAMAAGDPAGADAREACRLHRDWLLHYWTPEMMTEEAHTGLVEAYSRDERFAAYYEKIAPGCADFFAQAIRAYYRKE
ncbi:MAG: MerR family transcriptional regulator [Oscillospiraceae bacterium]|nr:MerR family transcriptional regulator [Oscillospiraceae bacterium]